LGEEQTLDSVGVLGALDDQHLALAADATPIFLLDAGWPDHRADAWFASLVGEQSTDQRFAIDLVRLRTSASAGGRDRRRVNDMALDTFALQDTVDPKPSRPASWMTMKPNSCPVRACAFARSWAKRSINPATSPARTTCFDIRSPAPGDKDVISHVDLDSSIETKSRQDLYG
jgi:hypothetical protein